MAEKIDNVSVVAGRLIRVMNTRKVKLSNAKSGYLSVWVEDANGKNERCLLFTDREIQAAEHRSRKNPEDIPKKNTLVNIFD